MKKPILCLDFDGVIHSYTSGWKGAAEIPDPPVPGAMHFLHQAVEHFEVLIFSSRTHQVGGLEAMEKWLTHHFGEWAKQIRGLEVVPYDMTMDLMAQIQWPTIKPPALVTLDDRALTFTGVWPEIQDLLAFQPWNKRT